MFRRTRSRFFFPGMGSAGAAGGGAGGSNNNMTQLAQMMQQRQQQGGGAAGGFPFDPSALAAMREQIKNQMTPEMREQMQKQMADLKNGGGGISIGAMGMGVNEKGKRVMRAAKLDFDPATGKRDLKFHEKQLDPDDPMLPKETVENYDTEDCIEVKLPEDDNNEQISGNGSNSREPEVLEVVIEDEPTTTTEQKKSAHDKR